MFEEIAIKRFDLRQGETNLKDKIVAEIPLTIFINDQEFTTLLCSPDKLKELAVGFLISESLINSAADIRKIELNDKTNIIKLKLKEPLNQQDLEKKRVITSGCGKGQTFYNYRDFSGCQPLASQLKVAPEAILKLMAEFQTRSMTFKETGGVHSAALCQNDKMIALAEDIGRHNAVDKIIGEVALKGESIQDKFLLLSGRISSEILIKAARLRVPLIVSRSAPTNLAVKLAKKLNLALIGFARGQRLNIY